VVVLGTLLALIPNRSAAIVIQTAETPVLLRGAPQVAPASVHYDGSD
jgi:hypothetical protein